MTYLEIHDVPKSSLSRVQVDDSPGFPDVPRRVQHTWEFPTYKVDDQQEKFQTSQVEDLPGNS